MNDFDQDVNHSMRTLAEQIAVPAAPTVQSTVRRAQRRRRRTQLSVAAAVAAVAASSATWAAINPQSGTRIEPANGAAGQVEVMSASPLEPRAYPAIATADGAVLYWGGEGATSEPTGDMPRDEINIFSDGAIYDVNSEKWQAVSPSPLSERTRAVAVWTGTDFLVGGGIVNKRLASSDAALYNPQLDRWTPVVDAPNCPVFAERIGGRIYTLGGCAAGGVNASFFEIETSTWEALPRSPIDPVVQALPWDGKLLAVGEFGELSLFDGTQWREQPPLPNPERSQTFAFGVVDGVLSAVINAPEGSQDAAISYQLTDQGWVSMSTGPWAPDVTVVDYQSPGNSLVWATASSLCRGAADTVVCADGVAEESLNRRSTGYPVADEVVVLWGGNVFAGDSDIESDGVTNRGVLVTFP